MEEQIYELDLKAFDTFSIRNYRIPEYRKIERQRKQNSLEKESTEDYEIDVEDNRLNGRFRNIGLRIRQ